MADELSDEHMRSLIGDNAQHPVLRKVRTEHFEAWLAAHDRRVKAEAWEEGAESAYPDPDYRYHVNYPANPYRTGDQ